MSESFHESLKRKMDEYIHAYYDATEDFPKDEIFGARSQGRRAAMSVMLNYLEGYGRQSQSKELTHFLKTSYGSLKESDYITEFAEKRKWMSTATASGLHKKSDEIGRMLWSTINKIDN